jgi:hypothetical protein
LAAYLEGLGERTGSPGLRFLSLEIHPVMRLSRDSTRPDQT